MANTPLFLATIALIATTAPAPASAQAIGEDVKCVLAGNFFTRAETDPSKRELARVATAFFAGRVDGRLTGAPLVQQLIANGKGMTPASAGPIMTACVKRFATRQAGLEAAGKQAAAAAGVATKK